MPEPKHLATSATPDVTVDVRLRVPVMYGASLHTQSYAAFTAEQLDPRSTYMARQGAA